VDGYLLKSDTRAELLTAIRAVAEGKRYIQSVTSTGVVSAYVRKQPPWGKEPLTHS